MTWPHPHSATADLEINGAYGEVIYGRGRETKILLCLALERVHPRTQFPTSSIINKTVRNVPFSGYSKIRRSKISPNTVYILFLKSGFILVNQDTTEITTAMHHCCWRFKIASYVRLLLWGKLSVFTSSLRRRFDVQTQLHSFGGISYRSRVQLAVYFRGLKETMQCHNGLATKWLQGSTRQTWQSRGKFSNRLYFRLIFGSSNYTEIKLVRKFSRIRYNVLRYNF